MKPKITLKVDYRDFRIYINGILHISFPRHKRIAHQAWYEGTEKAGRIYKIELDNGEIANEYHYDNFENWKQIISLIETVL